MEGHRASARLLITRWPTSRRWRGERAASTGYVYSYSSSTGDCSALAKREAPRARDRQASSANERA